MKNELCIRWGELMHGGAGGGGALEGWWGAPYCVLGCVYGGECTAGARIKL